MLYSLDQNFFVLYNEVHNAMIRLFTEIIRHFEYAASPSSTVEEQLKIILDKYNELMKQNKTIKSEFDKHGVEIRESWLAAKHINDQAKVAHKPTPKVSTSPDNKPSDQKRMSRSPKQTKLPSKLRDSSLNVNKTRQSNVVDEMIQSGLKELEVAKSNTELKNSSMEQQGINAGDRSIQKKESSAKSRIREGTLQLTIRSSKINNVNSNDLNNTSSQINRSSNFSNTPQSHQRSASHRLTDLQEREFKMIEDKFVKNTGRDTNLSQQRSPDEQIRFTTGSKERLSSVLNDSKNVQQSFDQYPHIKISFATEIANRPLAFSRATNGMNRESDLQNYLKIRSSNLSRDTKIHIHHLNLPEPVREETESIFGETPNLDQLQTDLKLTQSQMLSSTPKASEARAHIINKYKPNKVITLSQLKTFTAEFYTAKLEYDAKCTETKVAKGTPEEFLLMYLKQKYGLNELVQAWAFAIVDGLKNYANSDIDIAILLNVD